MFTTYIVKSKLVISQNCVAFSQNLNFTQFDQAKILERCFLVKSTNGISCENQNKHGIFVPFIQVPCLFKKTLTKIENSTTKMILSPPIKY
jgi:hypothetical protein